MSSRSLVGAALSGSIVACIACGTGENDAPTDRGEATLYVLFDERHGLEGGERVLAHDFDIGVVDDVELFRGRVRATLAVSSKDLVNLTKATTFTVEPSANGRVLAAHGLDDDADPLSDGDTVEGADSTIELTTKLAGSAASELWGEAADGLGAVKRELDAIDWSKEERKLREEWNEAREQLDESLTESYESAAKAVDALARQLERAGRSEQAERLRRRFEELSNQRQR